MRYMGDKGITGRTIIFIDKGGEVAWVKHYDIRWWVPAVTDVATAWGGVKSRKLSNIKEK